MSTYDIAFIIGQDDWYIKLPIASFAAENQAIDFAEGLFDIHLSQDKAGEPLILIKTQKQGQPWKKWFQDYEVTILEICPEKKVLMSRPLRIDRPDQAELAIQVLENEDPDYLLLPDDFVASGRTLNDLAARYGYGHRVDLLAYQVRKQKQPLTISNLGNLAQHLASQHSDGLTYPVLGAEGQDFFVELASGMMSDRAIHQTIYIHFTPNASLDDHHQISADEMALALPDASYLVALLSLLVKALQNSIQTLHPLDSLGNCVPGWQQTFIAVSEKSSSNTDNQDSELAG